MISLILEPPWFFGVDARHIPSWFAGIDSYVQIILFLISFFIAVQAYRISRLTGHSRTRMLGVGFLLISFSYLVWSILNLSIIAGIGRFICQSYGMCMISFLVDMSIVVHMALFILGLVTLNILTLRIRKKSVYILLSVLLLALLLVSDRMLATFYLISSLLLLILALHYLIRYLANGRRSMHQWLGIAYSLMLLANLCLLSGLTGGYYYVAGNILYVIGMGVILASLIRILRR